MAKLDKSKMKCNKPKSTPNHPKKSKPVRMVRKRSSVLVILI
mgnify:CR=1 FL=1